MRWQSGDRTHQNGGIDDPFDGRSLRETESDARRFHGEAPGLKSLLDIEVLVKGAKLAKDFNVIDRISISEVERRVLEEEEQSNQRGLREVIQQFGEGMHVTIMVTACAAAALGWQQSAINTSTRTWPAKLGLTGDSWKVAAINAIPSLSGSIIGTWVSDPLQGFSLDRARHEADGPESQEVRQPGFHLGRRFALMLSGIVSVVCCIWSARCESWQELLVCRVILGIAFGTKASVAPIFAAEAAMEKHRGRILMLWQLFDALGIMLGFVVALIAPASWEVQLGGCPDSISSPNSCCNAMP